VQRTGNLWQVAGGADDAARENEGVFVRAHVLAGIPLAAAGEIEDGDLHFAVLYGRSAVFGKIRDLAYLDPLRR